MASKKVEDHVGLLRASSTSHASGDEDRTHGALSACPTLERLELAETLEMEFSVKEKDPHHHVPSSLACCGRGSVIVLLGGLAEAVGAPGDTALDYRC